MCNGLFARADGDTIRTGRRCERNRLGMSKQRVIVLGSTGSIGQSTLDVLSRLVDQWEVVGLAAGSRAAELAQQADRFRPPVIALANGPDADSLDDSLNYRPRVLRGPSALVDLVNSVEFDCAVCAVVGTGGLAATLRAVELGKRVALANKEAMVIAGSILMPLARRSGATVIPVDSEHSAVFQAMHAGRPSEVRRVCLTASGGPFRNSTPAELEHVCAADALNHPIWDMGPKITIDSATMMNKALEVVEARWLFDLRPEQIEVVIHPESIIHSMVEFCDGSIIAQMSVPDMRTPIQYALTYPHRLPCPSAALDFQAMRRLSFEIPDADRFPAVRLGHEVARRGGTCGAVFNAANEAAVRLFRDGAIGFLEISRHVERVLHEHEFHEAPTLGGLWEADDWARQEVLRCTTC